MEATLTWKNLPKFQTTLQQFAALTERNGVEVLKSEAGSLVKDAAKLTPPTGKAPFTESFNTQRKAGEAAIEKDIRRGFAPARDLDVLKRVVKNQRSRDDIQRYLTNGQYTAAKTVLNRLHLRVDLVAAANDRLHHGLRDNRGRVRRGKAYLVMNEPSIAALIKAKQRRVGMAKSGWNTAAQALGVKLPGWVTRHSGRGIFQYNHRTGFESILVGNTVDFIQSPGAQLRIMERALKRREQSMRHRMDAMLGKTFGGYKAR